MIAPEVHGVVVVGRSSGAAWTHERYTVTDVFGTAQFLHRHGFHGLVKLAAEQIRITAITDMVEVDARECGSPSRTGT